MLDSLKMICPLGKGNEGETHFSMLKKVNLEILSELSVVSLIVSTE